MINDRKLSHSQNFLISPEFVGNLIDKTTISDRDLVIEVGPGKGVITNELSRRAQRVIGVEYDPKLAERLKTGLTNNSNIEIIHADFLKWNLPQGPYKVFANIPFNMTADIVNKLLVSSNSPQDTYLIMQDKAAERFIGAPVSTNSQMSILLQPFYDMSILTKIDRSHFQPIPKVNIVLVRFKGKDNQLVDPKLKQLYRDFVIYGYNQWQPTLLDAFKKVLTNKQLSIVSKSFGLKGLKPSELTINQWLGMFNSFVKFMSDDKKNIVSGAENRLIFSQRGIQKEHRTRRK